MKRSTQMSGKRLDVKVERDGQVVGQANAEVNMPNLLATVFADDARDRGEMPFAVGKDGKLYTPTAAATQQLEALGDGRASAPAASRGRRCSRLDRRRPRRPDRLRAAVRHRAAGRRRRWTTCAGRRRATRGSASASSASRSSASSRCRRGLTRNLSTLSDGVAPHRRRRLQRARAGAIERRDRPARASRSTRWPPTSSSTSASAVEQERIRRELELGRQIQHDMLPQGPLRLGLTEIKGVSVPAREVGGDFFNYFSLRDGRIALLVGDVSGKGVGAALLMANIQASLRTRLALGQDLAAIAQEIDVDIEGNTPGPVYATLFVGILDPATRLLRYVNAGHNPQYVLRADGRSSRCRRPGLPVGLLAGRGYVESARRSSRAGDLLFFYTDGCVEAENEAGDMFGSERLEGAGRAPRARAPTELLATRRGGVASVPRRPRAVRRRDDDGGQGRLTSG